MGSDVSVHAGDREGGVVPGPRVQDHLLESCCEVDHGKNGAA